MTVREIDEPLKGIVADAGTAKYGVYDHGAHVFAFTPEGQSPLLWLSEQSHFEPGKAIRGGIPIIFPWFGPGKSGDLKPAHGFGRTLPWRRTQVDDTTDVDGRLSVTYELDDTDAGDQPIFPFSFHARFRVDFAPTRFTAALSVTNRDEERFAFEEALHTYLAVGDVRKVRIDGLDAVKFYDRAAADPNVLRVLEGPVKFTGETDRMYLTKGPVTLKDPVLNRVVLVEKTGSGATVVWNPWIDKAAAMGDFGDDEWQQMVCIEAANALDTAVTLKPGESHTLTYSLSLK